MIYKRQLLGCELKRFIYICIPMYGTVELYELYKFRESYWHCSLDGVRILPCNHSGDGHKHFTANNSQKYRQDTYWNSVSVLVLKLCLQKKESVAPCYPQDKETDYWVTLNALLFRGELVFGALLFSGEGNRWSTVLKRTGALLFSGEGNRCPTILKRSENW